MKKPRLLIVDDHQDTLDLFGVMLSDNYEVVACSSATEALAVLDGARPDVVVLDIGMMPMNGIQCLEKIRATPGYDSVPAVALTGWARAGDKKRFIDAGFQAVVTKPVLDEPLIAAVETLLNGRPGTPQLTVVDTVGKICDHGNGPGDTRGAA
jgi:CheY-like chemotaxis protein